MKNENAPVERPTIRKPAGVFIILCMIAVLGWAIGTFADDLGRLHAAVQALVYLIAGVVWIAPLKPLLRWMETGKWRE
jgi:predicted membrane channel-forming protein YqfA (hemolysin III family)